MVAESAPPVFSTGGVLCHEIRQKPYAAFRDTFEGKDSARLLAARVRFRWRQWRCRQASEQKHFLRPLAGWAIGASQVWQRSMYFSRIVVLMVYGGECRS